MADGDGDGGVQIPKWRFDKVTQDLKDAQAEIARQGQVIDGFSEVQARADQAGTLETQVAELQGQLEQQANAHNESMQLVGIGNELGVNLADPSALAVSRAMYNSLPEDARPGSFAEYVASWKGDEESGPAVPGFMSQWGLGGTGAGGAAPHKTERKPAQRLGTGGDSPTKQHVKQLFEKAQRTGSADDKAAWRAASDQLIESSGNHEQ